MKVDHHLTENKLNALPWIF